MGIAARQEVAVSLCVGEERAGLFELLGCEGDGRMATDWIAGKREMFHCDGEDGVQESPVVLRRGVFQFHGSLVNGLFIV